MTTSTAASLSAVPQPRDPRGSGTGGRFAVHSRLEPTLTLPPPAPDGAVDKYGFPVVVCPLCAGAGRNGRNNIDGDMCYGCGGTGHQLAPQVSRQVVAEFSAARRAAARPHVHELKAGDTVSRPYTQLNDAHFRQVVRVLVATKHPTRFEGKKGAKQAVAFAAAVDFSDGTRDVLTTDAVYARRGSHVDPAPFVARATGDQTPPATTR
jgi:hypothetical protein